MYFSMLCRLEQRCPLAQYGCPFSLRRLFPVCPNATVIHSADLQSFGIRRPVFDILLTNPSTEDHLSSLPEEIFLKIGQHLDGTDKYCICYVFKVFSSHCFFGLLINVAQHSGTNSSGCDPFSKTTIYMSKMKKITKYSAQF